MDTRECFFPTGVLQPRNRSPGRWVALAQSTEVLGQLSLEQRLGWRHPVLLWGSNLTTCCWMRKMHKPISHQANFNSKLKCEILIICNLIQY